MANRIWALKVVSKVEGPWFMDLHCAPLTLTTNNITFTKDIDAALKFYDQGSAGLFLKWLKLDGMMEVYDIGQLYDKRGFEHLGDWQQKTVSEG